LASIDYYVGRPQKVHILRSNPFIKFFSLMVTPFFPGRAFGEWRPPLEVGLLHLQSFP
jgi:hypothetical protein